MGRVVGFKVGLVNARLKVALWPGPKELSLPVTVLMIEPSTDRVNDRWDTLVGSDEELQIEPPTE